ncbi:hypothetical protein HA402_011846 [Bradysia odoriphaga]|nr:hypothetical protein HA402_011846 [Bradysia odoriphaga]
MEKFVDPEPPIVLSEDLEPVAMLYAAGAPKTGNRFVDPQAPVIDLGNNPNKTKILHYMDVSVPKDLHKLLEVQKKEFAEKTNYKTAWDAAVKILGAKRKTGQLKKDHNPDEYHIALIAYTLETPNLYSDFNMQTRTLYTKFGIEKYPYKSFFKFLMLAVEHVKGKPETIKDGTLLYRGCKGQVKDAAVGKYILFQHYVSTSLKSSTATAFGADVEFVISTVAKAKHIGLEAHSTLNEQEVLFWPFEDYLITDIKKTGSKTTIYAKNQR